MIWADAHANLPSRARWIATADVAPSGATKRVQRRPSHSLEGFLSSSSEIDRQLIQAYLETDYTVFAEPPFSLRVGQPSAELLALLKRQKTDCSAFLTACNPLSQPLSADSNAVRQSELAEELKRRSLDFIDGAGQHPSNGWPAEHSFLVLGLTLEAAKTLAVRLEQNGLVWAGADGVPQLVLLR